MSNIMGIFILGCPQVSVVDIGIIAKTPYN